MAYTDVFLLRSSDSGAPVMNGTAGSQVAVLNAALVDGFNSKTVASITRSGTTATVTFATAHNINPDGLTKVELSGANETEYNGKFKPFNFTALSYDITVTGTPASPATGTITAKVAAVGWSKPFSGTNKAAYRAPAGNRLYLRVDDANPNADSGKTCTWKMYESMTDVDTGVAPTQVHSHKSNVADSSARSWFVIGDGYEFFLFVATHSTYPTLHQWCSFGDPPSEMSADPYGCLLVGNFAAAVSTYPNSNSYSGRSDINPLATQAGHYMARRFSQTGTAVLVGKQNDGALAGTGSGVTAGGYGYGKVPYPAGLNNGFYAAPTIINEPDITASFWVPRAKLTAIWNPLHTAPLGHLGTISNLDNLPGRTLLAIATNPGFDFIGETLVDLTGPWR